MDTELPFPSDHSSTRRSQDFVVRYQVSLKLASGIALRSWVERPRGEWSENNEKLAADLAAHLPSRYEHWGEYYWRKFQPGKAPDKRTQHCWALHVASVLLGVAVQSLKLVKLLNQQLPTFLKFCDNRSVVQQLDIRLHGSFNIFGASPELGRLSHSSLQSFMGCILPTTHCRSQHCWELLHLFAHHCQRGRNNSYHCWHPFARSLRSTPHTICARVVMFSVRPLEALNAFIPFSCSRLYDLSTRWYL